MGLHINIVFLLFLLFDVEDGFIKVLLVYCYLIILRITKYKLKKKINTKIARKIVNK